MSLTRIDNPTPSAPAALADYVQILAVANGAILQALRGNSHACIDFTNNFARAGVVFYVAGVLYKAVTDQAISGTPSKYVKITPSGATAAIAYVASLSGVSWNDAQSGYYDGSNNLYVFDEARAVYDGVVASPKTNEGQIAYIAGSLNVKSALTVLGAATISGASAFAGLVTINDGNFIIGAHKQRAGLIGSKTYNQVFDALSPYIPNVNDKILLHGAFYDSTLRVVSFAARETSTRIGVEYILTTGASGNFDFNDGDATTAEFSISW